MRTKVTALAMLAVVTVLVAASIALVASHRRLLTQNLDETLTALADDLETLVLRDQVPTEITGLGEDDTIAQVVRDGTVVAASGNIAGADPVAPPSRGRQQLRTVTGVPHEGATFRIQSRSVDGPRGTVDVHVAGPLDDVDSATSALRTSLSLAVPVVAVLLGVLIWWLVGRTLRPVEAIRAAVAGIGGSHLDRRVPVPPGDDEIARLARTMNTMLARVDEANRRQARFVADASHELRSPLTRIRSELEVDVADPDSADPAATRRSVLEEVEGLQQLVDDLLQLARTDAVAPGAEERRPVDLDDIVVALARRLRAGGRVRVELASVTARQVIGHAVQLTRVAGNLVDNASRHAAETVTLTLVEAEGSAVLAVSDDGPGIAPEDRERIFDRFTRLDEARAASTGGTGLGLSIARDIVERHGGTLTLDPDHHPGARFVVTLPISQTAASAPAPGAVAG